ncbi:MAG TPA: CopG family antitoxin [Candidatus Kapabacteria bacterium]|nr:CopG family antitoxin [Candidatus Kapabacteria bacterium]
MTKKLLPIPTFKTEDEEFEFWSTHDTTDYFDWSEATPLSFPNLKTTENIDLRLKELMVMRDIERLAKEKHTSKRNLILQYLSEAINRETHQIGL